MLNVRLSHIGGLLAIIAAVMAGQASAAGPEDRMPESPAKAVIIGACASCHGLDTTLSKNRTEAEWDGVLSQMSGLGASLSDDERRDVLAYLTTHFGPTAPEIAPPHSPPSIH